MVEKKIQKTKVQSEYLSDGKTSEEEVNPHLCMSEEEQNIWDNKRICTGYTGSVITYKSAEQSDGGKSTTETALDKETFQRAGT